MTHEEALKKARELRNLEILDGRGLREAFVSLAAEWYMLQAINAKLRDALTACVHMSSVERELLAAVTVERYKSLIAGSATTYARGEA